MLLHKDIAAEFAPQLAEMFRRRQVEMRGDDAFCALVPDAKPAKVADWDEEYLDLIITVAVVVSKRRSTTIADTPAESSVS